jgi:hypothetical protein
VSRSSTPKTRSRPQRRKAMLSCSLPPRVGRGGKSSKKSFDAAIVCVGNASSGLIGWMIDIVAQQRRNRAFDLVRRLNRQSSHSGSCSVWSADESSRWTNQAIILITLRECLLDNILYQERPFERCSRRAVACRTQARIPLHSVKYTTHKRPANNVKPTCRMREPLEARERRMTLTRPSNVLWLTSLDLSLTKLQEVPDRAESFGIPQRRPLRPRQLRQLRRAGVSNHHL